MKHKNMKGRKICKEALSLTWVRALLPGNRPGWRKLTKLNITTGASCKEIKTLAEQGLGM